MCVEKAWSPICTRVAGGRLRADLNSNAHRDKHERASCLETTCKRKEIKFDLDIQSVRFLRNMQANVSNRQLHI